MVRDMQSRHRLLARTALTGVALALAGAAAANPVNPTVVHGDVGFTTTGPVLEVRQGSDKAIVDWRGFDIAAGETTRFIQPGSNSIALNRVGGTTASMIDGSLTANGRIFIVNPNGILFGAGSSVDVGGLVATTANITNERFVAGDYRFDGASSVAGATVANNGVIKAGMAALVAPQVRNTGTISAELGSVSLGAGQRFTLDLAGDGLIAFDAGSAADGARLRQAGLVQGARVLLSAASAARVVDNVIDMTGVVEARGVRQEGGDIVLDGGLGGVSVAGTLDASGTADSGRVRITGDHVDVNADLNVKGALTVASDTGPVSIGSGVTVNSTGSQAYQGDVSLAGNLVSTAAGAITVSGGLSVRELATVITAGSNGDAVTLNAVNGPGFLTIDAGAGNVTLGTTGASQALAGLSAKGGAIQLAGVTTTGLQDYAGTVTLNGNLVSTLGGAIRVGGAVTLAGDSVIVTAGGGGDTIAVTGAVNGPYALQVDAGSGSVTMAGAVGATSALKNFAAGGSRVSVGNVTTTGLQDYAGSVTLNGNLVSTLGGAIRVGGPVTLAGDSVIVTAGGGGDTIAVTGAVNGPYALQVDAGSGSVTMAGAVGATSALKNFAAGGSRVSVGSVTTTGLQDYAGSVNLNGNLVSNVGGNIRLGGPVTLAGNSTVVTAGNASDSINVGSTVNGPYSLIADAGLGSVSVAGAVGGTGPLTLFSASGARVALGDVTTTGPQDYAGAITLNGNLVSSRGGGVRLTGPITLAGDSTIVTAGYAGDDISVAGTVDGAQALLLDAGNGTVALGGAVGASTALKLLSVGGSRIALRGVRTTGQQDYAGAVTLNGDLISLTGGAIRVGGPLVLAGDSTIVTAGNGTDDIRLVGTVDGAYALVVDAGQGLVNVSGAVGGTNALKLLSVGGRVVDLRSVRTTGQQDYAGTITLNGSLTSTVGGAIRLGGPVTLAADSVVTTAGAAADGVVVTGALTGPYQWTIRAGSGSVALGGLVNGLTGLDIIGGTVNATLSVTVTGALSANAARLVTAGLTASSLTLGGTDALSVGAITASQDISVTGGKAVALSTLAGRAITLKAGDTLSAGTITASQDVAVTGAKAVTLGNVSTRGITVTAADTLTTGTIAASQDATLNGARAVALGAVSARGLTAAAGTSLQLSGVTAENATLSGLNSISSNAPLNLTRNLLVGTGGVAAGLQVRVGALTYRGPGSFDANGTVAGVDGRNAADLVQVAGSRSGSYLFAGRPVFGIATLVDRNRVDLPVTDTVPTDRDGSMAPLVLDPVAEKDDLITYR